VARYRLRLLLQEFDVPPGETLLGRSPECHVTIDDPLVSREHAKIVNHGDRVALVDLGSRNGSKVNGETIRGEIDLKDGDRIRIGNQEILFTQVVQPKRPGRPTASLRNCRQCHTPYLAEAPSCPHCGHVPGAEETLSGTVKVVTPIIGLDRQLDRQNWSLQLQLELLEKAISLRRSADADRILKTISAAVDERLEALAPIDFSQMESVFTGAMRLSVLRGDAVWVGWTLATLQRMERMAGAGLVAQIAQLPPIIIDEVAPQLEAYVDFWNSRAESLEGPAMHALGSLAALRDEVVSRRGRPAPRARG
jgi:hypothetical protein